MTNFDTSKLSNVGKLAAKDYARFRKTGDRMYELVQEALSAGMSSRQIERALLTHCSTQSEMVDVLAVFTAVQQIKSLPKETRS